MPSFFASTFAPYLISSWQVWGSKSVLCTVVTRCQTDRQQLGDEDEHSQEESSAAATYERSSPRNIIVRAELQIFRQYCGTRDFSWKTHRHVFARLDVNHIHQELILNTHVLSRIECSYPLIEDVQRFTKEKFTRTRIRCFHILEIGSNRAHPKIDTFSTSTKKRVSQ